MPGHTGLSWSQAFAAISSAPAEALGLGGEIGSLRPGRRGDVVIWDGDPLELATGVEAVWIDGVRQSLENRQTRLRDRYRQPQEGALPHAYDRGDSPLGSASRWRRCRRSSARHFSCCRIRCAPALVARLGERGFVGLYSLVAVATLGWMIVAWPATSTPTPLWVAPLWWWPVASALMLVASILLVGSLVGNPAFPSPGARPRPIAAADAACSRSPATR